jgi:1-acyl-sn-glycerol-3-phosphate acyltransferase
VSQRFFRWQNRVRSFLETYWPTQVWGAENIPPEGPVILAGNHPTVLDGLVLAVFAPRRVKFLILGEVVALPLMGWALRRLGAIPVWRGGDSLQQARAALAQGDCIGIFPEALPTQSLDLKSFRRGVAVLAEQSGAPVIPVGLSGTLEAIPVDALWARSVHLQVKFAGALHNPSLAELSQAIESLIERGPAAKVGLRSWKWWSRAILLVPLSILLLSLARLRFGAAPRTAPS